MKTEVRFAVEVLHDGIVRHQLMSIVRALKSNQDLDECDDDDEADREWLEVSAGLGAAIREVISFVSLHSFVCDDHLALSVIEDIAGDEYGDLFRKLHTLLVMFDANRNRLKKAQDPRADAFDGGADQNIEIVPLNPDVREVLAPFFNQNVGLLHTVPQE